MLDETDVVCGADIFFLPALFADLTTLLRLCVDYKPEIKIILAGSHSRIALFMNNKILSNDAK